jgi:hypothetical protein
MANAFLRDMKGLWNAWKRLARKIGNFQARVLLTLLYAIVVLPFGLLARLFWDPLRIKNRPTQWIEHAPEEYDISWAQKQ